MEKLFTKSKPHMGFKFCSIMKTSFVKSKYA